MKHITIKEFPAELMHILELAHDGPVVLLGPHGKEYILAEVDDFDQEEDAFAQEVALLEQSETFMAFLAERAQEQGGISLEEFERKLEEAERQLEEKGSGQCSES